MDCNLVILVFQYLSMKDDNLEFTRCQAGNIETSQNLSVDEDVTAMEMTRNYENWEHQEDLKKVSIIARTPNNCSGKPFEYKVNKQKI